MSAMGSGTIEQLMARYRACAADVLLISRCLTGDEGQMAKVAEMQQLDEELTRLGMCPALTL
jgi:hypothetical protein